MRRVCDYERVKKKLLQQEYIEEWNKFIEYQNILKIQQEFKEQKKIFNNNKTNQHFVQNIVKFLKKIFKLKKILLVLTS